METFVKFIIILVSLGVLSNIWLLGFETYPRKIGKVADTIDIIFKIIILLWAWNIL